MGGCVDVDIILYLSLLAGLAAGKILGRAGKPVEAAGDIVLFLLVMSVGAVAGEHAAAIAGDAPGILVRVAVLLGASIAASLVVGLLVAGGRR